MLVAIAAVLFLAWLLGFSVFGVASAALHVLVILAGLALAAYFVKGNRNRSNW